MFVRSLKKSSFCLDLAKSMAAKGNSCSLIGRNSFPLKLLSPNDLSQSTNDVCEVLYKDSSVNLVPLKNMAVTKTNELV